MSTNVAHPTTDPFHVVKQHVQAVIDQKPKAADGSFGSALAHS